MSSKHRGGESSPSIPGSPASERGEVKLTPVWVEDPAADGKPAADAKPKPVWAARPAEAKAPAPPEDDVSDLAVLLPDSTSLPQARPSDDLAALVRPDAAAPEPKQHPVSTRRPPPPLPRERAAPEPVPSPPASPVAIAVEAAPAAQPTRQSALQGLVDRLAHAALFVAGVECTFRETAARSYEGRGPTWPALTNLDGMTDDNYRLVSEYVGSVEAETRTRHERLEAKLRVTFATTALIFALASGFALTKHPVFLIIAAPLLVAVGLSLRALGVHRFVTPSIGHQEALASRAELRARVLSDRLKAANANASAIDFMVDSFRAASRYFGACLFAVPVTFALGTRLLAPPDDVRVHVRSIDPAAASALVPLQRPVVAEPPPPDAGALALSPSDAGASRDAGEQLTELDAGAVPALAPSASAAPAVTVTADPPTPTVAMTAETPRPPAPAPTPTVTAAPTESAPPAASSETKPLSERP